MAWGWDTRLDAATAAGCRRAAWGHGHGQGVGEGDLGAPRCVRGKGSALSICCCRFRSRRTSEAEEGASSGGDRMEKGGGIRNCSGSR